MDPFIAGLLIGAVIGAGFLLAAAIVIIALLYLQAGGIERDLHDATRRLFDVERRLESYLKSLEPANGTGSQKTVEMERSLK